MTAICPSAGTSSARPGFAATVALTVPAIGALLNNVPTPWAVPFAALLGLANYELTTFCTIDPPTLPTLVASDFIDLLTLVDPVAHGVAQRKLQDFVSYYAWFQYCQCDTQPTPLPTAPQAQPTGMPAINPPGGGGSYPVGEPCSTFVDSGTNMEPRGGSLFTPIGDISSLIISVSTAAITLAGSHTFRVFVEFYNATPTLLGTARWIITSTGILNNTPFAVPAGTTQYRIGTFTSGGDTANTPWTAQWDFYCGSAPGTGPGGVGTPCIADPFTTLMLQQILQLVTLIQRNNAPFAYVAGASHSGLSGSGTLTIPSCIGILITMTTIPGFVGEEAGAPTEYFEAGWFSWGNAAGYTAREWISHSPQLSFPAEAAQYTRLGYTLNPGVVATIQELYAET